MILETAVDRVLVAETGNNAAWARFALPILHGWLRRALAQAEAREKADAQ